MGEGNGLDLNSVRKIAIFSECSDRSVTELLAEMRVETVDAGADVCTEGDKGHSMYFIQAGEVDVMVGGKKIATLQAGAHFGEMALLGGKNAKRVATVTAKTDCTLNVIDRKPFKAMLARSPKEAALFKSESSRRKTITMGTNRQSMLLTSSAKSILGSATSFAAQFADPRGSVFQLKKINTEEKDNSRIYYNTKINKIMLLSPSRPSSAPGSPLRPSSSPGSPLRPFSRPGSRA